MDIITTKKDVTIEFYSLALRLLKLLIELHYHPFLRDDEICPSSNNEGDSINLEIRHAKGIVLKDCEKFEKQLRNNPISLAWISIQGCKLILRALRVLVAIHFHVETGEGKTLPSLSKPNVKSLTKCALINDTTEFLIELEQKKEEVAI